MNEFLSWLGWGAVALLLAAMVVAGCEHLVREAQGQRIDSAAAGSNPAQESNPGYATVDVPLDTASAALLPEPEPAAPAPSTLTEHAARLAAVTQALARAASPSRAAHDGGRWMDTTPRIVGLNEPALRGRDRTSESSTGSEGEPARESGPQQGA